MSLNGCLQLVFCCLLALQAEDLSFGVLFVVPVSKYRPDLGYFCLLDDGGFLLLHSKLFSPKTDWWKLVILRPREPLKL